MVFLALWLVGAKSIDQLVAADRSFEVLNRKIGWRDASIAVATKESIVLQPQAVNALKAYRAEKSNPKYFLKWQPRFAEIAPSGDLGYTVGVFRESPGEGNYEGVYFTVWKKQSNHWKLLLDSGVRTRLMPSASSSIRGVERASFTGHPRKSLEATQAELIASGGSLNDYYWNAIRIGARGLQYGPPNRFRSPGQLSNLIRFVSASGDFALCVGTERSRSTGEDFARIWRINNKGRWKISAEMISQITSFGVSRIPAY